MVQDERDLGSVEREGRGVGLESTTEENVSPYPLFFFFWSRGYKDLRYKVDRAWMNGIVASN